MPETARPLPDDLTQVIEWAAETTGEHVATGAAMSLAVPPGVADSMLRNISATMIISMALDYIRTPDDEKANKQLTNLREVIRQAERYWKEP
jgi:hypothetical protein